jgi:predicted short-subunit dehydrogenase-like oxidoreductase (DUF2520 family)
MARGVAVVGAGRLARAVVPLLARAGQGPVAVYARRIARARAACRAVKGARAVADLAATVRDAPVVLLAVTDRAIETLARRAAALPGIEWRNRVVLHHAGALGVEPLAPLERRGAAVGVLHPLQCLGGGRDLADLLPGSRARIDGDPRARRAARRLARAIGLVPLRFPRSLNEADRSAYHAAGGLVSNDLVALVSLALELLESTGLDRRAALAALGPILRGTLTQIERDGPLGALTGPAPRGDAETLRRHLKRLSAVSTEGEQVHRLLSRELARLAARARVLDAAGLRRILRAVGRLPGRRL